MENHEPYRIFQCPRCKLAEFERKDRFMGICRATGNRILDDPAYSLDKTPEECKSWDKGRPSWKITTKKRIMKKS